jgi:SPP1 family predicted phage head-tail adaptor
MRLTFIDPGTLRTELRLEQVTQTPDGFGGKTEIWNEIAVVFGRFEPLTVGQMFRADQDIESATHRITIRMRGGVKSAMRFKLGARLFRIVTVTDPDETGRYLNCYCEELI